MNPGDLVDLGSGATLVIALASIAFGLLNCFFGYRIFRVLLGVYGFVLGALVGAVVAGSVSAGQVWVLAIGAIVGGIVGAALMVLLYFVGVFAVGAVAGMLLANAIGVAVGIDVPTLVVIIVAGVVGIVALILQRVALVLATAFSGAWTAVAGVAALLAGESVSLGLLGQPEGWTRVDLPLLVTLAAWLLLGVAGAVVQFQTTREQEPAAPAEPKERW